jgi:hypothetical protein
VARHRRRLTVRDDGLAAVIDPLVAAGGIDVAVFVDVDSGMLLDAWVRDGIGDVETLGAAHAETVKALLGAGPPAAELILSEDDRRHHVLRSVADPAGGRLVLAVVVGGSPRMLRRVRRVLRQVPEESLTAGPEVVSIDDDADEDVLPLAEAPPPRLEVPALAQMDTAGRARRPGVPPAVWPVQLPAPRRGPAPPAALPPGRHGGGWQADPPRMAQPGRAPDDPGEVWPHADLGRPAG